MNKIHLQGQGDLDMLWETTKKRGRHLNRHTKTSKIKTKHIQISHILSGVYVAYFLELSYLKKKKRQAGLLHLLREN
jgi:hypothetical protein